MATSFPTGSDNFTIPNSPGSTALSSSGTGSRNHVQHHRDLGDAVEAMEAEATRSAHSHDSSTARHGNKLDQVNTHQTPDTDVAAGSLHHTLGHLATQVAPGNHASLPAFQDTHANSVSWPVGSIYLSTSATNPTASFGGTWVQITDAFLVGAGGAYSFTGSVVANSSSHDHSIASTTAAGSHTHTLPTPSNSQGAHTHTGGTTGGSNVPHSHGSVGTGTATSHSSNPADGAVVSGGGTDGNESHTHTMTGAANYASGESSHDHSVGTWASTGSHAHSVPSVSGSTHSHTTDAAIAANLPTWKAFYVWKRTV